MSSVDSKGLEEGIVSALLPGALVKVKLNDGDEITAHVAEQIRRVSVGVKQGDRVVVKRAMNDPKRGSIVRVGG